MITGLIVAFEMRANPYSGRAHALYRITVKDDMGATWTGTPAPEFGAATGRRLAGYRVHFYAKVIQNRGYGKWAFKYPHKGKIIALPA